MSKVFYTLMMPKERPCSFLSLMRVGERGEDPAAYLAKWARVKRAYRLD